MCVSIQNLYFLLPISKVYGDQNKEFYLLVHLPLQLFTYRNISAILDLLSIRFLRMMPRMHGLSNVKANIVCRSVVIFYLFKQVYFLLYSSTEDETWNYKQLVSNLANLNLIVRFMSVRSCPNNFFYILLGTHWYILTCAHL